MAIKRIRTRTKAGLDELTTPLPKHTEDELHKLIDKMIIEYFVNAQAVEDYRMDMLAKRVGLTIETLNVHVYSLLSKALKQIKELEDKQATLTQAPPPLPTQTGLLPGLDM